MMIWDNISFKNIRKIYPDQHREDIKVNSDTSRWDILDAEHSFTEKKPIQ